MQIDVHPERHKHPLLVVPVRCGRTTPIPKADFGEIGAFPPSRLYRYYRHKHTDRHRALQDFIIFWKMMPPGTISLISVPELEELPSVSLPPMREARSRIPCSPKCPSFPRSAMTGSIPVPLSPTRSARLCAYLSSTS